MLTNFRLFHLESSNHSGLELPRGFIHFGTCLRSLVLTHEDFLPRKLEDYEILEGRDAYEFLLQVICGLRSQLFGETEILGQFRDFVKKEGVKSSRSLHKIFVALTADAKKVRTKYLQNLGSHSYGSLLRRRLKPEHKQIHFLGAGNLVEEILPWLKKGDYQVCVYTRNPEKHTVLVGMMSSLQLLPLDKFDQGPADVVILAAPLDAKTLVPWVIAKKPQVLFDLRGTSDKDPIAFDNYFPLNVLFADIETNQLKIQQIEMKALQAVSVLADEKYLVEVPRPFGWDDLWAM